MKGALDIARTLWLAEGLPADFLKHLKFHGNPDTAINSSFRIGAMAQATIGVTGLASAYLQYLRTGVEQEVSVDARHANLEFNSHSYYTLNHQSAADVWDSIAGVYPTKDNSYVRIHTNFPHHRKGILDILDLPDTPSTSTRSCISTALAQWTAEDFESISISAGMCASKYRTFEEWDKHPHAKTLAGKPPVSIMKIGDAPPRSTTRKEGDVENALGGIRVLDLSRVLAGPVAGRTLAAHGADTLFVTSPKLPALPGLDVDTSRGKRTTQLDLSNPADHATFKILVGGADVFLQAYRPGGLAAKGFGTKELYELQPGIICANLCAWGWEGVWKDRRGFDSLVQTATGFNHAEAKAYHEFLHPGKTIPNPLPPRPFPYQALDYAGGYLLAFGVITALCRSITEGGSYEVRVSLAGVADWLRSLGRIAPSIAFGSGKPLPPRLTGPEMHPEVQAFASEWSVSTSGKKEMVALRHPAVLNATPCVEGDAPVVLNAHKAQWL